MLSEYVYSSLIYCNRKFKCQFCNKKYWKEKILIKHLQIHSENTLLKPNEEMENEIEVMQTFNELTKASM